MTSQRKADLEARWQACCSPLAGCQPYTNHRPFRVKEKESGCSFVEALEMRFPGAFTEEEWAEVFRQGLIQTTTGDVVIDGHRLVTAGDQFIRLLPNWVEPAVATDLTVIAEDEVLLMLDKPAPLPMHQGGRFYKNTLRWLMNRAWPEMEVCCAHRLDAETSGILVCVKGEKYRGQVQMQFEHGEVEKTYLARVYGSPPWEERLIHHTVPAEGRSGGRLQEAQTQVRVVSRANGSSLLEVQPITGRTHQIRVHLWQEGYPIIGDCRYLRNGEIGGKEIPSVEQTSLALRAWKVSFRHPVTGERVSFACEPRL